MLLSLVRPFLAVCGLMALYAQRVSAQTGASLHPHFSKTAFVACIAFAGSSYSSGSANLKCKHTQGLSLRWMRELCLVAQCYATSKAIKLFRSLQAFLSPLEVSTVTIYTSQLRSTVLGRSTSPRRLHFQSRSKFARGAKLRSLLILI